MPSTQAGRISSEASNKHLTGGSENKHVQNNWSGLHCNVCQQALNTILLGQTESQTLAVHWKADQVQFRTGRFHQKPDIDSPRESTYAWICSMSFDLSAGHPSQPSQYQQNTGTWNVLLKNSKVAVSKYAKYLPQASLLSCECRCRSWLHSTSFN